MSERKRTGDRKLHDSNVVVRRVRVRETLCDRYGHSGPSASEGARPACASNRRPQAGFCTNLGSYWPTGGCTPRRSGPHAVCAFLGRCAPTLVQQWAVSGAGLQDRRLPGAADPGGDDAVGRLSWEPNPELARPVRSRPRRKAVSQADWELRPPARLLPQTMVVVPQLSAGKPIPAG